MLDIVTATSASVHALTGSSRPGAAAVMQPFGVAVAPAADADASAHLDLPDSDAEVIRLADQVAALARRERSLWSRRSAAEDAVDAALPPRPVAPPDPKRISYNEVEVDGWHYTTLIETPGPRYDYRAACEAHDIVIADHDRQEVELGERFGLPRWEKLTGRASSRLDRWGSRLARLRPSTQAGLRAKAEASQICAEGQGGLLSGWRQQLATSISADALRIVGAEADARAEQDRQADGELLALGRAWEASCVRYERASADEEAGSDAFDLIAPPEALFNRPGETGKLGPCPELHLPSGRYWYGDLRTIDVLRGMAADGSVHPRRDEVIQASDRWRADIAAENERSGLAAARAERQACVDENAALRARICLMPARTQRGIDLKLRVILWLHDGLDSFVREMEADSVDHPEFSDALVLSLALDLARQRSPASALPEASRVASAA